MNCFYHDKKEASQECSECHKPLCSECCYINESEGIIMCKDCAATYNKKLKNKLIRQAIYLAVLVICFILSIVFFAIKKPVFGVIFLWVGGVIPAYTVVSDHITFLKNLPNNFLFNLLRILIGLVLSPLMIVWYVICFIGFAKDYKGIQAIIKDNKQIEKGQQLDNNVNSVDVEPLKKRKKIFLIILLCAIGLIAIGLSMIAIKSFASPGIPNIVVDLFAGMAGLGFVVSIVFLVLFLVTNHKIKKNK